MSSNGLLEMLSTTGKNSCSTKNLHGQNYLPLHTQMNLEHASGCLDSQCPLPVCVNLKMAARHARTCVQRECGTCFQVKLIAMHHVKSCKRGNSCPMPLCLETKVKQEYMKLLRELGGEVDSTKAPESSAAPAKPGSCPVPRAKRRGSRDSELDDVFDTPQKLPRYGAAESLKLRSQHSQRSGQPQRKTTHYQNGIHQQCHSPVWSIPAGKPLRKPCNSTLEVLQQLLRVIMLLQNSGQEATVVGLLERIVQEAQAKMTSFEPDHVGIPEQQRSHDSVQGISAAEEQAQHLSSPLNVWCPSPDFIRELYG